MAKYKNHMKDLLKFDDAILENNTDVAKEILDAGMNPNSIMSKCSCENSCYFTTLLYVACKYDRRTIAKMLLEKGANPDEEIGFVHTFKFIKSPFCYVVSRKNPELMSVLLQENKVKMQLSSCPELFCYGMFQKLHDDKDVMKAIVEAESVHERPYLCNLLHAAAKHGASKLCTYFVDYCGIQNVVEKLITQAAWNIYLAQGDDGCAASTLQYLMNVQGPRHFVEDDKIRPMIMEHCSGGVLEIMLEHMYQAYGNNKEWWMQQMMTKWGPEILADGPPFVSIIHGCLGDAFDSPEKSRFEILLSWGVYSALCDLPPSQSLFLAIAQSGNVQKARMFVSIYPQCLQEQWLKKGQKPWTETLNLSDEKAEEVEAYCAALAQQSQTVPKLKVLCRSVIFTSLGINPIPKAKQLPLPKEIIEFVQCKEVFEG